MTQTSFPVPEGDAPLGPCRWCGAPAVGVVEVEPAKFTSARGVRVMARRPLEAPACADHINILLRQPGQESDMDA